MHIDESGSDLGKHILSFMGDIRAVSAARIKL